MFPEPSANGVRSVCDVWTGSSTSKISQTRLKVQIVYPATLSERDVSESIDTAREFARRNPVSLQTVLDVQLGMTQRGMAPEFAKKMSGFVANVGVLTGQEGAATADTVGAIFDAIGSRLQGTAENRIRHIGDVLAQTKYQFGMTLDAEGMRKSIQAANRLNIGLEELVTVMGTLKRAGFDEASAGQATEQLLTRLTAASQKWGFQIVRNTDGTMDWAHTLRSLRQEIGTQVGAQGIEAVDAALGEIAGPRGKSAITALFTATSGANAFGAELAKLRESGGFVDKTAKEKLAEAGAQLEKLKENLNSIGAVIGGVLLPGFSRLLAPVGRFSAALAKFSQEHKTIGAVIGTTAAVALTFGAAIFGVGYAMTYIRAPFLAFRAWLRDTEKNAVGASIALHAMAAAQREAAGAGTAGALGAAAATKQGLLGRTFARIMGRGALVTVGAVAGEAATGGVPAGGVGSAIASVGSAIGGLSAGPLLVIGAAIVAIGVAVYKFWQPIGAFFSGLWAGIGQGLAPVGTAIREAFAPLKPVFDEASKLFSGLFEQAGLSSEGFKKAFGAGLWWGQKFGSVIGAVLTTVIHLIAFAISSVLTLGQVLADLGKGKPGAAWEHAKAWWKESGMHGKAIGGAWGKIFESPDYSAVGKAGDDLRAAEERKNAQSALKQKANQQRSRGVELESQAKALHEKIEVFGDPTGSLGAALTKLQGAIDANTRELKQTEYRMEHPEPAAAPAQTASAPLPKPVGAATKHLAKSAGIPHASSHRLTFHHQAARRMAEGGIASRPTNVIFGEAGTEAIIPLRRPATLMLIGAALAAAMPTPRPIAVPQNAPAFNLEQYLPRRPESREAGPTYSITNQITVQADGANTKDVGRVVADEVERRIEKLMHGAEARRRGALKN